MLTCLTPSLGPECFAGCPGFWKQTIHKPSPVAEGGQKLVADATTGGEVEPERTGPVQAGGVQCDTDTVDSARPPGGLFTIPALHKPCKRTSPQASLVPTGRVQLPGWKQILAWGGLGSSQSRRHTHEARSSGRLESPSS